MKTILGNEIPKSTRGILYLCQFDGTSIEVCNEILCENASDDLHLYAEIPNPESQLVTGKSYEELTTNLVILHANMKDEKWLKQLSESI